MKHGTVRDHDAGGADHVRNTGCCLDGNRLLSVSFFLVILKNRRNPTSCMVHWSSVEIQVGSAPFSVGTDRLGPDPLRHHQQFKRNIQLGGCWLCSFDSVIPLQQSKKETDSSSSSPSSSSALTTTSIQNNNQPESVRLPVRATDDVQAYIDEARS